MNSSESGMILCPSIRAGSVWNSLVQDPPTLVHAMIIVYACGFRVLDIDTYPGVVVAELFGYW